MAKWRVLIVDDSKTAQARLRKMLERFDLEVDTVLSAEEALGYLSYRQPAVVFLDHHMEGMDGLEALKIIKSNPATALIPVIMYTSEKGDLYVGQARALGAMDILGKEVIKQASLDKVLASLGIPSKSEAAKLAEESPRELVRLDSDIPTLESYVPADLSPEAKRAEENLEQVQRQVSRLFEIHIAKVRQEIEDSTKFLLRRLAKESSDRRQGPPPSPPPPRATDAPGSTEFVPEPEPENNRVSLTFLGLILICIAFLGYHLYINNRHQEILIEQYKQMIARVSSQEELFNRLFARITEAPEPKAVPKESPDRQVFMDALSWAVNVDTQIGFGEQGLNDQRIYMLGELLSLLKTAEFSGVVYLDVHLGNYCVVEDPSGHWILPEPESNVEECVFLADRQPSTSIDGQVSVGFLNYLNTSPLLSSGKIHVEIASQGYTEPRSSYPPVTSATSAGEWNKSARKNHRITVSFSMSPR